MAFFRDLAEPGLGADGGFQAFAGGLPVTDVVHQLVHMGIEPLLSFHRAPDFNASLGKPFNHKRRLIVAASKTVKHEHKQDVKLTRYRIGLNFLNSIPIFGGHLVAGDALL